MRKKNKVSCNDYLPPELETEILVRSPVKTLLKLRCVCKSWRSLIDSDDFISMHSKLYNNNNNNSTNSRLLVCQDKIRSNYCLFTVRRSDTLWKINEIGDLSNQYLNIFQSVNGLMLITHDHRLMKLWNPSIRKCLFIPYPPFVSRFYIGCYMLGFAPSSNDYKVVCVDYYDNGIVAVYSVNDRCWRVKTSHINVRKRGLYYVTNGGGIFSGGATYWVSRNRSKAKVIFSFDFNVEKFRTVQLPAAVKESTVWFIFRHNESIAVFTMSSENSCIWVMGQDGEDGPWRLWFTGKPNSEASNLLKSIDKEILYVQKTNTFVMVRKKLNTQKVMSYNLTTQEIQHLGKSLWGRISLHTYMENLLLHKEIEGETIKSFP